MREIVVEDAVIEDAEKEGWMTRKMTYAGRHGCRDRDFYGFGEIVMVEFKRPNGKPRIHQERERKRMAEHGLTIHVIDDIDAGIALLAAKKAAALA